MYTNNTATNCFLLNADIANSNAKTALAKAQTLTTQQYSYEQKASDMFWEQMDSIAHFNNYVTQLNDCDAVLQAMIDELENSWGIGMDEEVSSIEVVARYVTRTCGDTAQMLVDAAVHLYASNAYANVVTH